MIKKPTTKKDKMDRRNNVLGYRKEQMREAWLLDKDTNVSPLALYWKKDFGKTWDYTFIDAPHHIAGRDSTGKYDGIEWLITLNRLEHRYCEDGCKPLKLTGSEYTYLLLWLLRDKPNNRWDKARQFVGKKITRERMKEIHKLAETLV
jgi:hypothetical protein